MLGRLGSPWIRERALHVEELRLAGGQDGVLVREIRVDDLRRDATHPGDDLDGEELPQPERKPAIVWVAEPEWSRMTVACENGSAMIVRCPNAAWAASSPRSRTNVGAEATASRGTVITVACANEE